MLSVLWTNSPPAFAVNGTGLPDVDFDVGESYAGLLSISENPNAAEKLFFWFWPSTNPAANKEIVLWLNGGVSWPSSFHGHPIPCLISFCSLGVPPSSA